MPRSSVAARSVALSALALLAAGLLACSRPNTPEAQPAEPPPPSAVAVAPAAPSAARPAVLPQGTTQPASSAQAPSAQASAAQPVASAAPAAPGSAAPAADAAQPGPAGPAPRGKVVNIGMHIGGGPNDDATKEPIKKSVEPHFEALRRCYALAPEGEKGDFGLDLKIDKDGGKAKISHPRTAIKDKAFSECVLKVFEQIDFRKPRTGTTVVSYSLRFSP